MSPEPTWKPWPSYGHRLGQNLRDLRRLRGLTQERLGDLAGLARNTISNIERNENNNGQAADPQLSTLYRLAKVLDVPPSVLLPAGDQRVDAICPDVSLNISIVWPRVERDTLPFSAAYLQLAKPGDPPEYAVATPREDPGIDEADGGELPPGE
ncbi:Helix-turn-helix protein [Corynebacterium atrinae]|uniref:helix-turn-helix domain-containing protein n=1 Tax=Corynebacterium atrinae TaxID=1336740 RepID=UPI0025B43D13|nr:helix-turn-helix transcriptional regulator [Corynebacterium atrinae]WJY62635.1 Helix-turn-helix protein [Corynebacterium atrinae]